MTMRFELNLPTNKNRADLKASLEISNTGFLKYKCKLREGWLKMSYEQKYFTPGGRNWGSIQLSRPCCHYFCKSNGESLIRVWPHSEIIEEVQILWWLSCRGHSQFPSLQIHSLDLPTLLHSQSFPPLSSSSSRMTWKCCIASLTNFLD